MRFITISAAVLLGSALSAANAQQQLGASNATPSKTPVLNKGFTAGGPSTISVSGGSDTCGTATAIAGVGTFAGDTLGATTDGPAGCGNQDVWYNWTAASTGSTTVSFCAANGGSSTYDTIVGIYNTTGCTGTLIICNDDFCGLQSQVSFAATAATVYKIRVGGFSAATGSYVMAISAAGAGPANDGCATPTPYAGGVAPWSNTGATTDGGSESCGTPQQDVWYSWTATCDGIATFTLCPGGGPLAPDTVIAAYAGVGCPTAGTAIGCDDDTCSSPAFGTSRCTFNVTSGSPYILRIGGFGGATGSGNFEVTCFTPPPPGPCDVFDDGSTENSVGTNNPAHDILWMHSQGEAGGTTVVNTISTAWGSLAFGGAANGSPARVGIWTDPNGDGNPNDAGLLQQVATVVAGANTDALQTVALSPSVLVTGKYFIGASCTGGTFAAPLDQSSGPGIGRVWIVGSTVGAIDYTNLAGEEIPPTDEDTVAPGFWLLRGVCKDTGTEEICGLVNAGDCVCGNDGAAGNGCANSVLGNLGAHLSAVGGGASLGADDLDISCSGVRKGSPTLAIFFSGPRAGPNNAFDGRICVGNPLLRLWKWKTPGPGGGEITLTGPDATNFPEGGNPAGTRIAALSAALGSPIAPGQKVTYQVWYRDPAAGHGCVGASDTSNYSNALEVTWDL